MTTEQLQCFFKIAELRSFSKAADALFLSQPALSKRIRALEQELGLRLFFRDKSAATELTPGGMIVYEGFLRLEKERELIIKDAMALQSGESGTLRLGIYESQLIDDQLREILERFTARYPTIDLIVTTASLNGLHDEVSAGTLDCAVTLGFDILRRKDLSSTRLYSLPNCLVVPNRFLNRLSATAHLQDFSKLPFLTISRESNIFQDEVLRQDTLRAGFSPDVLMAQDEKNFVMMLEMGRGIAPLNTYHKCCSSPNVTCFQLPELMPHCDFYLIWNPARVSPQLKKLLTIV